MCKWFKFKNKNAKVGLQSLTPDLITLFQQITTDAYYDYVKTSLYNILPDFELGELEEKIIKAITKTAFINYIERESTHKLTSKLSVLDYINIEIGIVRLRIREFYKDNDIKPGLGGRAT